MENIRYSIIIPHYNTPELLVRCVESIPERSDIQIIVVDDNSPGSDSYKECYPELTRKNVQLVLTKKGGGAGYARNEGLKHATGKWVLFADADDFYVENFSRLLDEHYESNADIVYFNIRSVMSDDVSKPAHRNNSKSRLFEEYAKTGDCAPFRCNYCEPWGKMVRMKLIKDNNIRFDETRVDNDHYFSVVSGCLAKEVEIVDEPLYVVTLREGSLSYGFADDLEKLLIRLGVETRVQIFERQHGYVMKPMPIRGLMVLLLKKNPVMFLKQLMKLKKQRISIFELLAQMFSSRYIKK